MTKAPKHGEPHTERHEHHIYQEKGPGEWALEIAIALMVAGTLAATAVAAYWTSWQWSVANDQLDVMRDQERRQLRAYVGASPGNVDNFGDVTKQNISFVRKNYGATPAYNVGFSQVSMGIFSTNMQIDFGPGVCGTPNTAGLVTMFPTVEMPFTIKLDPKNKGQIFPQDQIDKVKTGDLIFIYWGTICYHDAFNVSHYTNYCWMHKGLSMAVKDAEGCLQHNDSN
jgi:hypothetical protein